MCLKYHACAQNLASGSSPPDPPDPPDPPEVSHSRQNRPWVPHAGGQDDGSLHKLPQTNGSPRRPEWYWSGKALEANERAFGRLPMCARESLVGVASDTQLRGTLRKGKGKT